jgi:hypothetical protein
MRTYRIEMLVQGSLSGVLEGYVQAESRGDAIEKAYEEYSHLCRDVETVEVEDEHHIK